MWMFITFLPCSQWSPNELFKKKQRASDLFLVVNMSIGGRIIILKSKFMIFNCYISIWKGLGLKIIYEVNFCERFWTLLICVGRKNIFFAMGSIDYEHPEPKLIKIFWDLSFILFRSSIFYTKPSLDFSCSAYYHMNKFLSTCQIMMSFLTND